MNPSAEKRKMPRMQVNLSAGIVWGVANNRSNVNVQDLSIHGISFRAGKYFTRGTQFKLILPNQKKGSGVNNIQAEVVRCKTLNGFSLADHFEVGAKFSFKARRKADSKVEPITEALLPLQPIELENSLPDSNKERLQNHPMSANATGALRSSAFGVSVTEVNAEFIRSIRTPERQETVLTRIQIKQVRLISLSPPSSTRRTTSLSGDSAKLPAQETINERRFLLKRL
jgi:hypothetical protein